MGLNIKGHSIIELTDVNTGEVERYENDNIVTNAVQLAALQDLGMLYSAPIKYDAVRNTPIKTLFGGIMLLDDNIQENANIVTMPGGLGMTANGAAEYVAQGIDGVTEFGSWNYTESGWTSDGKYKLVWDWAKEHGNGTIKCACLTSRSNGYIGIGNKSGNVRSATSSYTMVDNSSKPYVFEDLTSDVVHRIVGVSVANSNVTYVDYYNIIYNAEHAAEHMGTTGKVKLKTAKLPITKFDLRESYKNNGSWNNEGGQGFIAVTEEEITLPAGFVSALGNRSPWLSGKYGDYYYMLASNLDLAPNATTQGVRINCITHAVQGFTVTNTTSSTWSVYAWGVTFGSGKIALYDLSGTKKVIFQDILNNPSTSDVEVNIDIGSAQAYSSRYGVCIIREDSCFIGNDPTYRIDMVGETVTPVNASTMNTMFCPIVAVDNPFLFDIDQYSGGYWNAKYFFMSYANDYIATINNLAEPVVKTAEKTMKVTYILSFS